MAAPSHIVFVIRQEWAADGGGSEDESPFDEPIEPGEDALAVQGIFFQAPGIVSTAVDKLVYITRDSSGNLLFRDNVDGTERTLTRLLELGSGGDGSWSRYFLTMGG